MAAPAPAQAAASAVPRNALGAYASLGKGARERPLNGDGDPFVRPIGALVGSRTLAMGLETLPFTEDVKDAVSIYLQRNERLARVLISGGDAVAAPETVEVFQQILRDAGVQLDPTKDLQTQVRGLVIEGSKVEAMKADMEQCRRELEEARRQIAETQRSLEDAQASSAILTARLEQEASESTGVPGTSAFDAAAAEAEVRRIAEHVATAETELGQAGRGVSRALATATAYQSLWSSAADALFAFDGNETVSGDLVAATKIALNTEISTWGKLDAAVGEMLRLADLRYKATIQAPGVGSDNPFFEEWNTRMDGEKSEDLTTAARAMVNGWYSLYVVTQEQASSTEPLKVSYTRPNAEGEEENDDFYFLSMVKCMFYADYLLMNAWASKKPLGDGFERAFDSAGRVPALTPLTKDQTLMSLFGLPTDGTSVIYNRMAVRGLGVNEFYANVAVWWKKSSILGDLNAAFEPKPKWTAATFGGISYPPGNLPPADKIPSSA